MVTLHFESPHDLGDHFQVAVDFTPWNRKYMKVKDGRTPDRQRASFQSIQNVLSPKTELAHSLDIAKGLHVLAFDVPVPSLYVGIAAVANSPEGILRRMRKHCIKAMGSNVGNEGSHGGVHHPSRWADFAIKRHACLNGAPDQLSDMRFMVAHSSNGHSKNELEKFRRLICSNFDGYLDAICEKLWPGLSAERVCLLNSATVGLKEDFEHKLIFNV